jgi:hypothetical protein
VDRDIPKKETGYPDANQFNWINRGFPAYGFWIRNAKNIKFENVHVKPSISNSKRPCIKLAENTEDIFMDGVMVKEELLKCD